MKASRSSPLATLAPTFRCLSPSHTCHVFFGHTLLWYCTLTWKLPWKRGSPLSCERVLWTSIMWHLSWQIYHISYLCFIFVFPSIYPLSIHMIASLSSFNPPRPDIVPSIRIEHVRVDAWHWWIQCQNVRKKKCVWNDIPNARNLWKVQVKSSKLISFPTRRRVGPEDFQHLWISWPLRFASKSHALDTSGHCWDSKEVAGDVWMAIQTWADLNDLRWLQIHQITTTSKVNRRRIN